MTAAPAPSCEPGPGAGGDRYVIDLEACAPAVADRVGGKARGLGSLTGLGLPVPAGFAVTVEAYRRFVEQHGLHERIASELAGATGDTDTRAVSTRIAALFDGLGVPDDVRAAVLAAYDALGTDDGPARVAVRSSATAEDTAAASFAGQQETYLWIRGREDVLESLVRCWASLFTPQAIAYRARFGVDPDAASGATGDDGGLAMAVVVQRMVPARCAGVLMTLEPVSGDASTIYLEATYGVGEGVVRGDVGTDRHWVDKADATPRRAEIGHKERAHRFDDGSDAGAIVDVPPEEQDRPALGDDEVVALAELGRRIEDGFGTPMDVEWAIEDDGTIQVLQARPETVWSRAEQVVEQAADPDDVIHPDDDWDPLHCRSAPSLHWSTDNLGEAAPGVLSPLGWSLWASAGERACRDAFFRLGVLRGDERAAPADASARILRIFHGRLALQVDFVAAAGNRMPGTTGEEVVRGIFGRAPEDIDYTPTRARYPAVAARAGLLSLTGPRRVRALADETDAWWRDATARVGTLDRAGATALLAESEDRFFRSLALHTLGLMGVVQPVHDALTRLVERVGIGDTGVLGGSGGAEMAVVADLWRASRGEIDVADVVARHGFHGPLEGELSGRVWREDDTALRRIVDEYARRPDDESPTAREARRREQARVMADDLVAAVPAARRPAVRALLALAARRLPLRGVGKRAYLQSIDVARAAARRLGRHMVDDGVLDDVDDVFLLTVEELTGGTGGARRGVLPDDPRGLVARRRRRRERHAALRIPSHFAGEPLPEPDDAPAADAELTGIGVSSGVVEGPVRVVTRPDFADVAPDEILVAPTTDPSWATIMFVSAGLVVDIGGALSHAAVVARELGLPCVVNTRTGTRALRTGDRVRVDGRAGTVTVLHRAPESEGTPP